MQNTGAILRMEQRKQQKWKKYQNYLEGLANTLHLRFEKKSNTLTRPRILRNSIRWSLICSRSCTSRYLGVSQYLLKKWNPSTHLEQKTRAQALLMPFTQTAQIIYIILPMDICFLQVYTAYFKFHWPKFSMNIWRGI